MNAVTIQRDVPQIRDRSIERLRLNRLSQISLTNPLMTFDFMGTPMPSKELNLVNEQKNRKQQSTCGYLRSSIGELVFKHWERVLPWASS